MQVYLYYIYLILWPVKAIRLITFGCGEYTSLESSWLSLLWMTVANNLSAGIDCWWCAFVENIDVLNCWAVCCGFRYAYSVAFIRPFSSLPIFPHSRRWWPSPFISAMTHACIIIYALSRRTGQHKLSNIKSTLIPRLIAILHSFSPRKKKQQQRRIIHIACWRRREP